MTQPLKRGAFYRAARLQAIAGGAWLGAGPDGDRKIEGTRTSRGCSAIARGPRDATDAGTRGTTISTRSRSTETMAATNVAGSAPAGESPTSTAAHAAASLPRMIIGLA